MPDAGAGAGRSSRLLSLGAADATGAAGTGAAGALSTVGDGAAGEPSVGEGTQERLGAARTVWDEHLISGGPLGGRRLRHRSVVEGFGELLFFFVFEVGRHCIRRAGDWGMRAAARTTVGETDQAPRTTGLQRAQRARRWRGASVAGGVPVRMVGVR